MGGEGSGRPPGVNSLIERSRTRVEFMPQGDTIVLPNLSGIQSGAKINNPDSNRTIVVGDHGTSSTPQVVNVVYGTDATPAFAANTTPIGTIYVCYTA